MALLLMNTVGKCLQRIRLAIGIDPPNMDDKNVSLHYINRLG